MSRPTSPAASSVTTLDLPVDLPLGLFRDATYRTSRLDLEPGDRVVFVTDGMLERNAVDVDLPAAIAETRSLHPREAVRALADRVLEATGNALSDDATVLCLDWHGGHGRDRDSVTEPSRVAPARRQSSSRRIGSGQKQAQRCGVGNAAGLRRPPRADRADPEEHVVLGQVDPGGGHVADPDHLRPVVLDGRPPHHLVALSRPASPPR